MNMPLAEGGKKPLHGPVKNAANLISSPPEYGDIERAEIEAHGKLLPTTFPLSFCPLPLPSF